MGGYYRKLFVYIFAALAVALLLVVVNSGALVRSNGQEFDFDRTEPVDTVSQAKMEDAETTVLVLCDPEDAQSVKYRGNLERVFGWLRIDALFLSADRKDTVSYQDYDLVMIAFSDWEGLIGGDSARLLRYVDGGGRLLLGMMPDEVGGVYQTLSRRMGVTDYGDYLETDGIRFTDELTPGATSQVFQGEDFGDVALSLQVESGCDVYATALAGERETPLAWRKEAGEGAILSYNGTAITGDGWTGFTAGCVTALLGEHLYPAINTKTVFIDDFPSPQYNTQSDVIEQNYNRTVQEFFRDIWWPDMQNAARSYDCGYVGLFIATYDDVVDPEDFLYQKDTVEQYFGNSLLDNDFEIGAHGYNHQSLALEGGVPDDLGYNSWASEKDMAASLVELRSIASELFPGVKLYAYVPPSNYLDADGRDAVKEALPDLQVISGVYTGEGEEGSVYVQDFEVASDGIVEFPRITSGTLDDPYDRFVALNVGGLYGVYSHFIHPDDILDEERGRGLSWEELYRQYTTRLQYVNDCLSSLKSATAMEAAESLRVAEQLDVAVEVGQDRVEGRCNGFTGQAYCYFRTDGVARADNDSCMVTPVSDVAGEHWYLVEVLEPTFSFALEERP